MGLVIYGIACSLFGLFHVYTFGGMIAGSMALLIGIDIGRRLDQREGASVARREQNHQATERAALYMTFCLQIGGVLGGCILVGVLVRLGNALDSNSSLLKLVLYAISFPGFFLGLALGVIITGIVLRKVLGEVKFWADFGTRDRGRLLALAVRKVFKDKAEQDSATPGGID